MRIPQGALAYERTQYFNYGPMIPLGVTRDALKRIDTAEANLQLLVRQLLDRLAETISELSLTRDYHVLPREVEAD
jgi:hypothetical protein